MRHAEVDAGTLRIAAGGSLTAAELAAAGGQLAIDGLVRAPSLDVSGAATLAGGGTLDMSYRGSGPLTYESAAGSTFAGTIANGSVTMQSGQLTLAGASAYAGGTTIGGGLLTLGNDNALGTGGLTVSGGTLDLHGYSPAVAGLGGAGGLITNNGTSSSTLAVNQSAAATFYRPAQRRRQRSPWSRGRSGIWSSPTQQHLLRRHDGQRRRTAIGRGGHLRPGHRRPDDQRRPRRYQRRQPRQGPTPCPTCKAAAARSPTTPAAASPCSTVSQSANTTFGG